MKKIPAEHVDESDGGHHQEEDGNDPVIDSDALCGLIHLAAPDRPRTMQLSLGLSENRRFWAYRAPFDKLRANGRLEAPCRMLRIYRLDSCLGPRPAMSALALSYRSLPILGIQAS